MVAAPMHDSPTEIKVFGGLCFTVHGDMAGVTGADLMVRLAPDEGEAALAHPACVRWTSRADP
jgi:hypothetical protein